MLKFKNATFLLLAMFFCGTTAIAQTKTEVTDGEIEKFVSAVKEVQLINQQAQQEMIKAIQNKDLEVQRFNEMYAASQDPQTELDASAEETQKFNNINKEIIKIQTNSGQKMEEGIKDQDLTVERYQEINAAIQNDPALMQKVQKLLQGEG